MVLKPPLKTYLYRCSRKGKCGARCALQQPLEWYKRAKRCPGCNQDTLKLDRWQMIHRRIRCHCNSIAHIFAEPECFYFKAGERRDHAQLTCQCDGELHYPHRSGSKGCRDYPYAHNIEEIYERYGVDPTTKSEEIEDDDIW